MTILVCPLLAYVVIGVIAPLLERDLGMVPVGGVTSVSASEMYVFYALSGLSMLLASILAFFMGGFVAGRVARSRPGLKGATSALAVVAVGFAGTVWIWLPGITVTDPIARSDNMGTFLFWIMVLCFGCPFVVLTSFFGGRVGGRLRSTRGRRTERNAEAS